MATTAPEPEDFRVTKIEFIEDDENRFPPVPVATVMVGGMPYDVTLDAESMTVDTDAFSGSGLDYDDIGDINYAIETFRAVEEIEPSLTQAGIESMVEDLSLKTGVEYEFRHFSGDQYELRSLDTEANAWVTEGRYNGLHEAHREVKDLVSAAPEINPENPQPSLEVLRVDVVRDSDNLFPPTPVAVIKYNQAEHDVTLDPETLRVATQTFDTSGLSRDDIDLVDDCIQAYTAKEQIEPTISEKMLDEMVKELSTKTGVEHSFHYFSGDQYQLDEYSESDRAWVRAASYESLGDAWMGVQNLIDEAPELQIDPQVVGNLPVDSQTIDLDQFAGPVVSHVQTYPGGIGKLPSAEAVLNTYKHDLTLVLDPQTLRVDVAKSHAPNFELDEKALARIHGEIEHMRIENGLQPPLSEDKVAAISDGLEYLTGELHDFRQVGDKWELRKRDEENNWQHLKQYNDIPEAYLDVIRRSEVAELKLANPAAGETLDAMLTQLDKNTAQEIKPVDPAALPEPVDLLQAGPSDLKSGMDNMRKAVAEAPIGQPHSANGSRLSQEVVEKTLQMMLAQLDRNEEQQKQAVKR